MNNQKTSRTSLFLMELILSILFFSLAAAVCVQMFVSGHILSKKSVELNHAVVWCESIAECFYSCDGNLSEMSTLLSNNCPSFSSKSDNSFICSFDDEYEVKCVLKTDSPLLTLEIDCYRKSNDKDIIYSLSPVLYPQSAK